MAASGAAVGPAAPLFEKVELRGEGELAKIQALLDEALEARLQDAGELTEGDRAQLRAASADFIAHLSQFVVLAEEAGDGAAAAAGGPTTSTLRTQLTPAAASALHSPLLKPLSPPPADAEVQQLEAEVNEASQRVAALRTSMQAALQEQLAAKLAALRPTAELDDQEPAASAVAAEQQQAAGEDGAQPATEQQQGGEAAPEQQGGSGEAPAAPPAEQQATAAAVDGEQAQPMEEDPAPAPALQLSPQADELQARLLAAANRMPALRARLEQATDRLQRVVAAVAADIARPPPNTVEKAVLGKTPGRPGTGRAGAAAAGDEENVPGVSPLLQQALESGQIETRRGRVPRDVQPVPYSQPE